MSSHLTGKASNCGCSLPRLERQQDLGARIGPTRVRKTSGPFTAAAQTSFHPIISPAVTCAGMFRFARHLAAARACTCSLAPGCSQQHVCVTQHRPTSAVVELLQPPPLLTAQATVKSLYIGGVLSSSRDVALIIQSHTHTQRWLFRLWSFDSSVRRYSARRLLWLCCQGCW